MTMHAEAYPVAVIGAGPVGLAAAAQLIARGEDFMMFEQGDAVGAGIRGWGHVRLFSPWRYVIDEVAGSLLTANGWTAPNPETYPTGHEIVEHYLTPLAALPEIRGRVRLNS